MKKTITREVEACDNCGGNDGYDAEKCKRCGRAFCYDCKGQHAVKRRARVFFEGSGDAIYCRPCDALLLGTNLDPLHAAYVALDALKLEWKQYEAAFERRMKAEEARLAALLPPR